MALSFRYYFAGVNTGTGEVEAVGEVGAVPTPEVAAEFERRIRTTHSDALGSRLFHTAALGEASAWAVASAGLTGHGLERERHRVQREAIAEVLAGLGVLGKGHCLIEVGAGNGALSLAVAEAHPGAVAKDALLLVDQGSKPKGKQGHNRQAADPMLKQVSGIPEETQRTG